MIAKRLHIILSLFFAVVIAVSALVFPTSIPLASAAETVVAAYEEQNIMQDLEGSTVGGKPFDVKDYPRNTFGHPQIIHFVEFCYSYDAEKQSDFGLYVYVYNPQQVAIDTDTERNKIEISYGNKAGKEYSKYVLEFLNYSTETGLEGRFYKFKLRLSDAAKQSILNNVNEDERVYEVVGIELSIYGKVEDYTCAQKYTYTGFAKGYGSELAEGDTVFAWVDGLEEFVELDVEHTFYRTKTSDKGLYFQNQVNTVYFAVPERFFEEYGELQRIKAEWREFQTNEIVVTSNLDYYLKMLPYIGVPVGNPTYDNYREDVGFTLTYDYKFFPTHYFYGGWNFFLHDLTDDSSHGQWDGVIFNADGRYRFDTLFYLFLTDDIKEYDPDADITSQGGVPSHILEDYIYNYDKTFNRGTVEFNGHKVSADLFQEDIQEDRKRNDTYGVIQSGFDGMSCYDFDAGVDLDALISYKDSGKNWWDQVVEEGSWGAIFHPVEDEESRVVEPIKVLDSEDLEGSDTEIAYNLMIQKSDVKALKDAYNDAVTISGDNDEPKRLVMFRFAVSDYFSSPMKTVHGTAFEVHDGEFYAARQTVFLDFDVIQLSFTKDNSLTAIPVVSSPIDIVNDVTTPSHIPDDGWLKYVLAVIALIIVLIILAPLLPYVFKFLLWLLMLPAKLVVWIINLFKRKNE